MILIAAHPSPRNKANAILMIASYDDANLVNIVEDIEAAKDNITELPDWIVAARTPLGLKVMGSGRFPKDPPCQYDD